MICLNVYYFISLLSGKVVSSNCTSNPYSALNKQLNGALQQNVAVMASIEGGTVPAMTVHELKWLLFLIPNNNYWDDAKMYNRLMNFECGHRVNKMSHLLSTDKGERFKLLLFHHKHDKEPICCILHEGGLYWSMYNFICVTDDKNKNRQ